MTIFDTDDDTNDLLDRLGQISVMLEQATRKLDNQNIEAIIANMSARLERQLATQIEHLVNNAISAMFSGTSGGGQAGIGTILSAFLPRLAKGGVVDGATSFAIGGEAGPEAVLPLKRMSDGRLGVAADTSHKADPVQLNVTINQPVDNGGDHVTINGDGMPLDDLADLISRAIDDAIDTRLADHHRQGGILGRGQIGGG